MPRNLRKPFDAAVCAACRPGCPLMASHLSMESRRRFSGCVRHRAIFTKGEEVFSQGEQTQHFYIVSSGWICLYMLLEDGRRQNVGFALPGDIVGYTSDPSDELDHAAVAVCNVTLCAVDRSTAADMFAHSPDLLGQVTDYLLWKTVQSRHLITSIARKTAVERVAYLFYELFLRSYLRDPQAGDTMAVPLTQSDIGDAVGLSSVHVCRMLSSLRSDGVLNLRHGKLTVHDPVRLSALAALDSDSLLGGYPLGQDGGRNRLTAGASFVMEDRSWKPHLAG